MDKVKSMLCKAKKKDSSEWVEGYYVCINNTYHSIYTGYGEVDCGGYYPDFHEINPKTICKCTGLPAYWDDLENELHECDVWEHDLLEVEYKGEQVVAEVKFEGGMFILASVEFEDSYIPLFDVTQIEDEYWIDAKVIGNIFDNSNLL